MSTVLYHSFLFQQQQEKSKEGGKAMSKSYKVKELKSYLMEKYPFDAQAKYDKLMNAEANYRGIFEAHTVSDFTRKNIWAGVMLEAIKGMLVEDEIAEELETRLAKAEDRYFYFNEKVKAQKGIADADFNIINAPALTKALEAGKLTWFDAMLISAISQAMNESFEQDEMILVDMCRVYQIMYGRELTNSDHKKAFISRAQMTVSRIKEIEGLEIEGMTIGDTQLEGMDIDGDYLLEGYIDDFGNGCFKRTGLMLDAAKNRNFIVIDNRFLSERNCKIQEIKNYLLYRHMQKKNNRRIVLKETMSKMLAMDISKRLMSKTLDHLASEGIKTSHDKSRIYLAEMHQDERNK